MFAASLEAVKSAFENCNESAMAGITSSVLPPGFVKVAVRDERTFWKNESELRCPFSGGLDYDSKLGDGNIHMFGCLKFRCLKIILLQEEGKAQIICYHTVMRRSGSGRMRGVKSSKRWLERRDCHLGRGRGYLNCGPVYRKPCVAIRSFKC